MISSIDTPDRHDVDLVVFLCRCIDTVSSVIDLDRLRRALLSVGGVAHVEIHDLLCSDLGKQCFISTMKELGARRAVVAACSVREHERTFRRCMSQAGCNGYQLAMTNLREHCAWTTPQPKAAYAKALSQTLAAIARAKLLQPLEAREIDCSPDLLIIGGGIAGVEAALLAAQAGRKVTLVEGGPSIGGRVAQIEDLSPTLECTPCLISPRLSAVVDEPNIRLLTCASVEKIVGFVGNFTATIERRARGVDVEKCLGFGCDACIDTCPVSFSSEFDEGLSNRKAIDHPFAGAAPNAVSIDDACLHRRGEECSLCAEACPVDAVDLDQVDEKEEVAAGAVIVATGCEVHNPTSAQRLGHGASADVYTLAELERILASDGPTEGRVLTSRKERPRKIAVIHCVGRSEIGYCSGVCCEASLKLGLLVNKGRVETDVLHFHAELNLPGPHGRELLQRARRKGGARLVAVNRIDRIRVDVRSRPTVRWRSPEGSRRQLAVDMVVLVTGMVPGAASKDLVEMLSLGCDSGGFLAPDHHHLRAAQTTVEGVYMAGCVAGPRNIPDSVDGAHAAAGLALAKVQPGKKLSIDPATAMIEIERCAGCLICVDLCPYQANSMDAETGKVSTNEVLCKGCGSCVAACPSGAAVARHFSDLQLTAEITEVLRD